MRQQTLALALVLASAPLAAGAHYAGAKAGYEDAVTHHHGMGHREHHDTMAHGEYHGDMSHREHHGGMGRGEYHGGMGHGEHHGGMGHREHHDTMAHGEYHGDMSHREHHGGMGRGEHHGGMGRGEHHAGMGHGEHHGGMNRGEHHGGMGRGEHHAGAGHYGGRHRHGERWRTDRPGSHHRRMMKALRDLYGLDLSDEQRAQVEEIHHELERTLWQLEGPLIDERARLRKLYAASEWDAQAIGKAYAAMFDLRRQRIEATIDAYNRARASFSEEQREQLRERRDRRRRHHGMGPAHMGMSAPRSGNEQAGHGMMAPRP